MKITEYGNMSKINSFGKYLRKYHFYQFLMMKLAAETITNV